MPPSTAALFRAARPLFRRAGPSPFFTAQTSRSTYRQAGRRFQSTAAPAAATQASWFKRMWDSPIGLKTVHFWAPVMKWALVIAGIGDFYRPAEKLSLTQNIALTCTGLIWTRWCMIIKPKNVLLATVNFFLGMVGIVQVSRIAAYNYRAGNKKALEVEAEPLKEPVEAK
ncbi:hypothetical protein B7463_g3710, partial [Scytalidium lignicola]